MDDMKLLRLSEVLEIIPVSKSSWWKGVAEGRYPPGYKLGPRTTAWYLKDIQELLGQIRERQLGPSSGS